MKVRPQGPEGSASDRKVSDRKVIASLRPDWCPSASDQRVAVLRGCSAIEPIPGHPRWMRSMDRSSVLSRERPGDALGSWKLVQRGGGANEPVVEECSQ